jgi:hypothetical protein
VKDLLLPLLLPLLFFLSFPQGICCNERLKPISAPQHSGTPRLQPRVS